MRVLLLILLTTGVSLACLWDTDTLAQEEARFPGTLELITGRFPRHSDEFYRWRLADRQRRLKQDPDNQAWLDDVAVSYSKLGMHEDAIRVARQQLARHPARYESLANLGTFLFHAGRLEEGIPFIEQALQVNPEAHFGRERYQLALVRYVLEKRGQLPLGDPYSSGFEEFLERQQIPGGAPAIRGVQGMMRFGQFDHPVLLEVLGDLLSHPIEGDDSEELAARAFLKASYQAPDPAAREAYREKASQTLGQWSRHQTFAQMETEFKKEQEEANLWARRWSWQERSWIKAGVDPEQEFLKRYREDSLLVVYPAFPTLPWAAGLLLLALFTLGMRKRLHRKRKSLERKFNSNR